MHGFEIVSCVKKLEYGSNYAWVLMDGDNAFAALLKCVVLGGSPKEFAAWTYYKLVQLEYLILASDFEVRVGFDIAGVDG